MGAPKVEVKQVQIPGDPSWYWGVFVDGHHESTHSTRELAENQTKGHRLSRGKRGNATL